MATIHVIGVGGIGSFLLRDLSRLQKTNQLIASDGTSYDISIYDEDDVEQKNLLYQDFEDDDILESKAEILGNRYGITYAETNVDDLSYVTNDHRDIIVCCVDNADFRIHLFEWQTTHNNFWIDLRSEGRVIVRLCRDDKNDLDYLKATLPSEENQGSGSCQHPADIERGIIQMGNRIVATVGCQTILNHIRGDSQDSRFTRQF